MIDVCQVGRHSDGGVFENSALGNGLVHLTSQHLPQTHEPSLSHVIVGDEAFPLQKYMLRPYPGRNLPVYLSQKINQYTQSSHIWMSEIQARPLTRRAPANFDDSYQNNV